MMQIDYSKFNEIEKELNRIYQRIPDTTGCLDNINKKDGCGAFCCFCQNPNLLKIEFINSWLFVLKNYNLKQILQLIEKALSNYMLESISKPCIFFNKETKECTQHGTRPLACRLYGITPEEEFEEKRVKLNILYKDDVTANFKPQCNLVQTVNGEKLTREFTDQLWNELKKLENKYGIEYSMMHDSYNGTYLTFHDHLILHVLNDDILSMITKIKQNGTIEEKHICIKKVVDIFNKKFETIEND